MFKKILCLLLLLCAASSSSWAAIEEYGFERVEDEERFKVLIAEMRCPMCLNSNLAGSDAPIAANLRAEIHDQILAGQSDEEIMVFMKVRYGDFISYRPPLNRSTFLLWFGPIFLLIAGFIIMWRMTRSSQQTGTDDTLSAEESERLQSFLNTESTTDIDAKAKGDKK